MTTRWTDAKLRTLKAHSTRRRILVGRGLYLVVEPSGHKSWRYRYKINGRQAVLTLGSYPELGLAAAEQKRYELETEARAARAGTKPAPAERARVERAERLAAPTVSDLAEEWLRRKGRAEKTRSERRRTLESDVLPWIGDLKVGHVQRLHCKGVIDRVLDREAPAQANYVHKVLRGMFRFAVEQGYTQFSPMQGMPSPAPSRSKDRALSRTEVRALFNALAESDMHLPSRLCLEWQFLSLSRPSEARLARWRDVDTGKGTWTIPAERSKNAKSHTVFLSQAMREALERARALRQPGREAFLFPGQMEGKPLSPLAVTRALKRLQPAVEAHLRKLTRDPEAEMAPFTWHDLRRTGASLVTSLGFSRFTAGLLLNHTDRSVTAIYDRNTYDREKRRAWEEFGNLVTTLNQGDEKVVALRRRTKADLGS